MEISIKKEPFTKEVWWEGNLRYEEKDHPFWIIEPQDSPMEVECRWWFKEPPIIRRMSPRIIETFKEIHHYDSNL